MDGRLSRRMAVLLLGLVATVGLSLPSASAHSRLEAVSPKDGASLPVAPATVTLTFNENVLPEFSAVRVIGPDGAQVQQGDPQVAGRVVTQPLRAGLGPGRYRVAFKVVSADSHPVAGASTFTVTGSSGTPSASSTSAASSSASTASTASASPGPSASPSASTSTAASGGVPGWLVAGALVLTLAAGAAVLLARGRRSGSPR